MYEKYFGLRANPFQLTPDLNFLFLSAKHKEAISCMEFGVMEDIGVILLTGEMGTGKTTLIRHILEGVENDIDVVAIYNTDNNPEQMLASILKGYGLPSYFENKNKAIKMLQAHLKNLRSLKRKPLLIIDDAQNLSLEALEDLRRISDLQNSVKMLAQIILVGQPALEAKLGDPNASSLAQRVSISYHLLPFGFEETEEYIIHRIKKSGGDPCLFTKNALDLIYSTTRGIPRSINLLCENAMSHAFSYNTGVINATCIKEVLKENRNRGNRTANNLKKRNRGNGATSASGFAEIPPQWQAEIARRMEALEQLVAANSKEMKALLQKERQRNDKLLIAYTHLKAKYDAIIKVLLEKEKIRAGLAEKKALVRSKATGRKVAQLMSHKNREREALKVR